jgi:hypothetical protein
MTLKSMVCPASRESLFWAGLFLAGTFCIQCTPVQGGKGSGFSAASSGKTVESVSPAALARMEAMAKSDPVALLELCLKHYRENYRDYTCVFLKQERMCGILGQVQEIDVKFMDSPFSVAMHWVKNPPSVADRLLYVEGKWKNQMLVRPAGLAVFVGPQFRPPDGAEAMRETLRPVTAFGFERTLRSLIDAYALGKKNGGLRQEFGGYATVGGRNALLLVRYLDDKPQYPAWKTLTYIDPEYLLPVEIVAYGWDDQHLLTCRYAYRDVKFNVGLTAEDFLPKANGMVLPH